jgi:hypothetical protein
VSHRDSKKPCTKLLRQAGAQGPVPTRSSGVGAWVSELELGAQTTDPEVGTQTFDPEIGTQTFDPEVRTQTFEVGTQTLMSEVHQVSVI